MEPVRETRTESAFFSFLRAEDHGFVTKPQIFSCHTSAAKTRGQRKGAGQSRKQTQREVYRTGCDRCRTAGNAKLVEVRFLRAENKRGIGIQHDTERYAGRTGVQVHRADRVKLPVGALFYRKFAYAKLSIILNMRSPRFCQSGELFLQNLTKKSVHKPPLR